MSQLLLVGSHLVMTIHASTVKAALAFAVIRDVLGVALVSIKLILLIVIVN
jgi:hypothetical protein